jgi:hypothetical protein
MRRKILILFIWTLKIYPIIFSVISIFLYLYYILFNMDVSRWIYDCTGASLYSMLICFLASYIFKFCTWYRILCLSSFLALILEWIDINITSISHYIYVVQSVVIIGILISLISICYDRRFKKKDNKSPKKSN